MTRPEILLGLAIICGTASAMRASSSATDEDLMRIGVRYFAAREALSDLVPDQPVTGMRRCIVGSLESGSREQLERMFWLCYSAMPTIHDQRPRPRASADVEAFAAAMQRRNRP